MRKKFYITTDQKLLISLVVGAIWCAISIYVNLGWIDDLSTYYHPIWAYMLVYGIAIIPGFFCFFLLSGLALDFRPKYKLNPGETLPPISILIAAYNEEAAIFDTLESIQRQEYPGELEVFISDDGSTDNTCEKVREFINKHAKKQNITYKLVSGFPNGGKSVALNRVLAMASHDLIISIDGDSWIFTDAIKNIALNYVKGPKNTAAVAGSVLVRNSRKNWITKIQEWEYFISIGIVKRVQSLFHGTLVAQGAFSLYTKEVLQKVGGWSDVVGEDIVLTWAIRELGHRVSLAENAIVFTNVPETYKVLFNQRRRWARGLIEAFKSYPSVIWNIKPNTVFIWINLLCPFLDFMFLFGFVPGLIFAIVFQWYHIVGFMTLLLMPLFLSFCYLTYRNQIKTFEEMGLKVRKNALGFVWFILTCQIIMAPACLRGYLDEFLALQKRWGTKDSIIKKKKRRITMKKILSSLIYLLISVIIILGTIFLPLVAFADVVKVQSNYDYFFDNEKFEAHQYQNLLKYGDWSISHTFYDAKDHDTSYSYNIGTVAYAFYGPRWSMVLGPGIVSTSQGTTAPGYTFIGDYQPDDKSNIELSAERSTVMGASFSGGAFNQVSNIADYLSDNVTLSGEYQLTDELNVSGGVLTQQFSDGNARYGYFDKLHYQLTDNFGVQIRNKIIWGDFTTREYFSPTEYQRHWLLLTYAQPLFEDRVVFKLNVGPGITKIDDRTEATWLVESKISGKVHKDVRLEAHAGCSSSTYDYQFCMVGAQVDVKF